MTALLDADPLVADYRAFFALLDWSVVDRWQAQQSAYSGSHGHPLTAYLKAFLIRIREGLTYSTRLRDFLRHRILCSSSNWAFSCTWTPTPLTASLSRRPCPRASGSARNCASSIVAC
jgi:hypothetical protein